MAKAKLKRGIELVKLANRIEQLKMQEDTSNMDEQDASDIPNNVAAAAGATVSNLEKGVDTGPGLATSQTREKKSLSKAAKSAIFKEVVLAKVREMKDKESTDRLVADATAAHERRKSFSGQN